MQIQNPSLNENEPSKIFLDAAFKNHSRTGPGLFESIYEVTLAHELRRQGLHVERQVPVPIRDDDLTSFLCTAIRPSHAISPGFLGQLKNVILPLLVAAEKFVSRICICGSFFSLPFVCFVTLLLKTIPSRLASSASICGICGKKNPCLFPFSVSVFFALFAVKNPCLCGPCLCPIRACRAVALSEDRSLRANSRQSFFVLRLRRVATLAFFA